jgi:uncharacterized repeat protein (TIGR04138 family)
VQIPGGVRDFWRLGLRRDTPTGQLRAGVAQAAFPTFAILAWQPPSGKINCMPPPNEPVKQKSLHQLAEDTGAYPAEAFEFVQRGLSYTVQKVHGNLVDPEACRHVSGPQLCHGLREFALSQWGLMARTVLRRWGITSTLDFGQIVFALIQADQMQRTEEDTLDDFRNVYDFRTAFESGYRIHTAS